ncbi:MAG: DUF4384 domain-containing protein [Granulosicoccus sp.]|nr:DUF4384 domain-containing protein [Granulosicoccus sp.]
MTREKSNDGLNLVAADLVGVVKQIKQFRPDVTQLHVQSVESSFDHHLADALESAGYIPKGSRTSESLPVNTSVSVQQTYQTAGQGAQERTYQIEIGTVKIKRNYAFINNQVIPRSNIFLKGTDASGIKLNDELFYQQNGIASHDIGTPVNLPTSGFTREAQLDPEASSTQTMKPPESSAQQEQRPASNQSSLGALTIQAHNKGASESYKVGEDISIQIRTEHDAHVYCYYEDAKGDVVLLFPNRYHPDNAMRAGDSIVLPESDNWLMTATRANKSEQYLCLSVPPNLTTQLTNQFSQPDLQPLPVDNLLQVYDLFHAVLGEDLIAKKISLSVH